MNNAELETFLHNNHNMLKKLIESTELKLESVYNHIPSVLCLNDETFIPANEKLAFNIHPFLPNDSLQNSVKVHHRHSFIELIYVYTGECIQYINNERITLNAGEICILDTNVIHSVATENKNDIVINCLIRKSYFDAAFLGRLKNNDIFKNFFIHSIYQIKNNKNYIIFHSSTNKKIHEIICNLLCEYFDSKMCSSDIIDSYMIILFSELLRVYKSDLKINNKMTFKRTQITDIITYIEKNYKTTTLQSTATYFNISSKYLSSEIKKLTGQKFMSFVHQIRIEQACNLLLYTDMPIDQIAHEVGYANIQFFYTLFKRYYGTTPHIYQQNQINKL